MQETQEMQVPIPGSRTFAGVGNDNPLNYSCLESPMNRGAWQATVHWVAKSQIWLSDWAHRYQKLHNTGSFNTLSQVGRCGSHIPRWRLGCRMLTREYSWDKHLWKRGRKCRVGQRENLSCDLIPMKASANLWETLEWDWPFRLVSSWEKGSRPFSMTLNEAVFLARQSSRKSETCGPDSGITPSSWRSKSFITEGGLLGAASENSWQSHEDETENQPKLQMRKLRQREVQ